MTERTLNTRLAEMAKTITDKDAELAALRKTLRDVLSVIDSTQAPKELAEIVAAEEEAAEEEITINEQQWFGLFTNWRQHQVDASGYEVFAVVEWPDLNWAKGQIIKVLGS